jgi:hypothetical protein
MHQVPLTLIIFYNNQALDKSYGLDYAILTLSVANLCSVAVEMSYYKYYKNRGINLEQRVRFSHWIRYKEYLKCGLLSIILGTLVIYLAVTNVHYQTCNTGFYSPITSSGEPTSECIDCKFSHGDSCLSCLDNFQCTACENSHFLDVGACFECGKIWQGCVKCERNGCTECDDGFYLDRGKCKKCLDNIGCVDGMCSKQGCH